MIDRQSPLGQVLQWRRGSCSKPDDVGIKVSCLFGKASAHPR